MASGAHHASAAHAEQPPPGTGGRAPGRRRARHRRGRALTCRGRPAQPRPAARAGGRHRCPNRAPGARAHPLRGRAARPDCARADGGRQTCVRARERLARAAEAGRPRQGARRAGPSLPGRARARERARPRALGRPAASRRPRGPRRHLLGAGGLRRGSRGPAGPAGARRAAPAAPARPVRPAAARLDLARVRAGRLIRSS